MRCSVLASGSTGNAVYVEGGGTRLLIDAGIGIRQLESSLARLGVSGRRLDALLVTHEHTDHIKGVPAAVRKWSVPVYASEGTLNRVSQSWKGEGPVVTRTVRSGTPFALGGLVVEPFPLSHDADEPLGFCVHGDGEKLVLMTDCGYVSERVREVTRGANAYVLETNHDVELLRTGPYPWHLKRRILGDRGHLSNEYAAEYLLEVLTEDTGLVYLAHLSQENNRPDLAAGAVGKALGTLPPADRERVGLVMTRPAEPTDLLPVRRERNRGTEPFPSRRASQETP